MSDRIAVFHDGRIDQVGTPAEIYESPTTAYVADFIGISNVLTSGDGTFAVRPERIDLLVGDQSPRAGAVTLTGTVGDVIYLGMVTRYLVTLPDGQVVNVARQNTMRSAAGREAHVGDTVRLAWYPEHSQAIAAEQAAPEPQGSIISRRIRAKRKKEQDS